MPSGKVSQRNRVNQIPLKTDVEGRFQMPIRLPRGERYVIEVGADNHIPHESKHISPSLEGDVFRWPDVVLRPKSQASGVVTDHHGQSISGVSVWSYATHNNQRVSVDTDAQGAFQLIGLHPDARLVFAEKPGYRITGTMIRPGRIELRLIADDIPPPGPPLRSVRVNADAKREALKGLIEPILPEFGGNFFTQEALFRLAPHDPAFVRTKLGLLRFPAQKVDVLVRLGEIDDALTLAAGIEPLLTRGRIYLELIDAVPDKQRKRKLLADALLIARRIEQPDSQVRLLSGVVKRLIQLGDPDKAIDILEDTESLTEELAPTGTHYARGLFAETLALVDLPAALKLIEPIEPARTRNRHLQNIAHQLARIRPADAEKVLHLIKEKPWITATGVRVCYRMAGVDLPRARRLADQIDAGSPQRTEANRAHAYGMMAMALAQDDPSTARELLAQAFDIVSPSGRGRQGGNHEHDAFPVAFVLLGFSEVIDPSQTRTYLWRTLALHPGPTERTFEFGDLIREPQHPIDAELALALGLYGLFPDLQAELMAPIFRHWEQYPNGEKLYSSRLTSVFMAMAVTDPVRTIDWHARFFPKVPAEDRRLIPQPWMQITDVLGLDGLERHQLIVNQVFHRWVIDEED